MSGNARLAFPIFDGFDGSYPFNYPYAKSVFFRKPGNRKPWSVCLDGQGRGLSHVSTPTLFGRKFFTWGTGRGGKHWMDFLSENGKGDYIEIQGGVTPTQLQTCPLEAGASIEWTECISPFAMDPKAAHDPDYSAACTAAGKVVDERVPGSALQEMDAFLIAQAAAPVQTLLHRGAGWGWLHEKRTGRKISPGLTFEANSGDEEQPWTELLSAGTFSQETLSKPPCSFNVSAGWTDALRESARAHGATWLHHFHLGVAELERGDFGKAREHFKSSLALKDNAPAHRCLALLYERDGDLDAAQAAYEHAWSLCGNDRNLAVEIGEFFTRHKRLYCIRRVCEVVAGADRRGRADRVVEGADRVGARRVRRRSPATAAGVLHDPGRRAQPERAMVRFLHQGSRGPRRPQADACREGETHARVPAAAAD